MKYLSARSSNITICFFLSLASVTFGQSHKSIAQDFYSADAFDFFQPICLNKSIESALLKISHGSKIQSIYSCACKYTGSGYLMALQVEVLASGTFREGILHYGYLVSVEPGEGDQKHCAYNITVYNSDYNLEDASKYIQGVKRLSDIHLDKLLGVPGTIDAPKSK